MSTKTVYNALIGTKPNETAIPTNKGWVDSLTSELLVSIKNLDTKLGTKTTRKPGRPKGSKNKGN
jgi:hypothetical protein